MMKKKDYQKPTTQVVKLQQQSIICSSPYSVSAKGGREQLSDGTNDLGWGGTTTGANYRRTQIWNNE